MNILILGGSKFMGLSLLEKLIEITETCQTETNIFIVNRGKLYWNGLFYKMISGKKYIHHIKADRENREEFGKAIDQVIETIQLKDKSHTLDYVIDFSCFTRKDTRELFNKLNSFFNCYIFISTDSTYNASNLALDRNDEYILTKENIPLIKENDLEISDDRLIKKKLKKRDEYGYNKAKCEKEVIKIFKDHSFDQKGKTYLILRLPDVIGVFDESLRLWIYIEWIKNSQIKPIQLEKVDTLRKLSFVVKDDVVKLISTIILEYDTLRGNLNEAYNVSCSENPTLEELLDFVGEYLEINYKKKIDDTWAQTFYPSVTCGAIDNYKAKNKLKFEPTNFYVGIKQEIEFFNYVNENASEYKDEYNEMIDSLPKEIKSKYVKY